MKYILVLALVATACARTWFPFSFSEETPITPVHSRYEPGREYVYKYNSQILTGLPTYSRTHAALKISCNAKLVFSSNTQAVMQLDDIKVLSLNEELPPHSLDQQLPVDYFTPLPSQQAELIKAKLVLPIKFSYVSGRVTRIQISSEETNWSVDIKRSVLAILQVNIKPMAGDQASTKLSYNNIEDETNTAVIDSLEESLEGNCYSRLVVRRNDSQSFNVTKSRDLDRCYHENEIYKYTLSQSQRNCECIANMNKDVCECRPSTNRTSSIRPITTAEYNIISQDGSNSNFLIQKCVQVSEQRLQIAGRDTEFVKVISNQTFVLVNEKPSSSIQASSYSWKPVNNPWALQVIPEDEESRMMSDNDITSQVQQLLSELQTIVDQPERYQDHLTVFYQLVETLKICRNPSLSAVFNTLQQHSGAQDFKKMKLFIDGLKFANSTVGDVFLLDKIANNQIKSQYAESVLISWTAEKVPSKAFLDELMAIIPRVSGQKLVSRFAKLCLGSCIHRYVQAQQYLKYRAVNQADKTLYQSNIDGVRKYEKFLENQMREAESTEDTITALKALTNAVSIKSLPLFQKMLANDNQPLAIRIHVIYALDKLPLENKQQVLATLLPILHSEQQDSELRMAAFRVIMSCEPDYATISLMKQIEKWTDVELKTFVAKYLMSMVQQPHTYNQQTVQRVRTLLKKLRMFRLSNRSEYGRMILAPGPNNQKTYFDSMIASWLSSNTTGVPRTSSFKILNTMGEETNSMYEFGYSACGMDTIINRLTATSSIRRHRDLNAVNRLQKPSVKDAKPSITVYIKLMDQHISFLHFDEKEINTMLLAMMKEDSTEYPFKYFDTFLRQPWQICRQLPTGHQFCEEHLHMTVIDLEGKFIMSKVDGQPQFTVQFTKPVRTEKKVSFSHVVKAGFMKTGLTSSMVDRRYITSEQSEITMKVANPQNISISWPNPQKDLLTVDLKAYTSTFVLPMRVPMIVRTQEEAARELRTDEKDRKQVDERVELAESVEMVAHVKADVNMPQVYQFVRDRMNLLPTCLATKRQHIVFTLSPATQSPRVYSLSMGSQTLSHAEISDSLQQSEEQEEGQGQWTTGSPYKYQKSIFSDEDKNSYLSMFTSMFGDSESSENSQESQNKWVPPQVSSLPRLSLDSLRRRCFMQAASYGSNSARVMQLNVTLQYEHDFPAVDYLIEFSRPPTRQESEEFQLIANIKKTLKPSTKEILIETNSRWGSKGREHQSTMSMATEIKPIFKDGECTELTMYGCKDQYGVVYPTWYNGSHTIQYENTEFPARIWQAVRIYFMNTAQSVVVYPRPQATPYSQSNQIVYQVLQKPELGEIDLVMKDSKFVYNFTGNFMPVEASLYENMFRSQGQLATIRPDSDLINELPSHHNQAPFNQQETCIVEKVKAVTFNRRLMDLPRTDCEVVLASDCASSYSKLLITLSPLSPQDSTQTKNLKVIIGDKKVELIVKPGLTFSKTEQRVKVDGVARSLDQRDQLIIKDNQQQSVAVVQCDGQKCELRSKSYGVYVSVNEERIIVKINKEQSNQMCGICAKKQQQQISQSEAVSIVSASKLPGQPRCEVTQRQSVQQAQSCHKLYKHKLINKMIEHKLHLCMTREQQPLCLHSCSHPKRSQVKVDTFCVPQTQADQWQIPLEREGDELYTDDAEVQQKFRNARQEKIKASISDVCQ